MAFGDRRFIIVGRAGLILESDRLAAPPEPPTLAATLAKAGKLRLVITGQEGQLYRVEASTDLRRWKVVTLLEGAAKLLEFFDETVLSGRSCFYRTDGLCSFTPCPGQFRGQARHP